MSFPPKNRLHALTLLEVLIALAIVVVAISLVVPSMRGLSGRAKAVNCAALMRQFGTAVLAYRGEHNGYFPPGYLIPMATPSHSAPHSGINLKKILLDGGYLKEIPYCPAMRLTSEGIARLRNGQSEKSRLKEMGSYALNLFLAQTKMEGLPGPHWGSYPYPGNSQMVFIAEVYFCGFVYAFDHQRYALDGADFGGLDIAPRDHGEKRLHFMFLDGHIALLGPTVRSDGSYDWTGVFDSWGRNGKYVNARRAYGSD